MTEPIFMDELSLLDKIRLVEAEITRKAVAAREASVQRMADARLQAAQIKKQAEEKGEREGQIHFKEIVANAEEQARIIIAQAHHEADALHMVGQHRMQQTVHDALEIVLGLKGTLETDES